MGNETSGRRRNAPAGLRSHLQALVFLEWRVDLRSYARNDSVS